MICSAQAPKNVGCTLDVPHEWYAAWWAVVGRSQVQTLYQAWPEGHPCKPYESFNLLPTQREKAAAKEGSWKPSLRLHARDAWSDMLIYSLMIFF